MQPLLLHWIQLCARFWRRVLDLPPEQLLHQALLADIALFLEGEVDCWSAKFLLAMENLRVFAPSPGMLHSVASVIALPIDEKHVAECAALHFAAIWQDLPSDLAHAPSDKIVLATNHHLTWGGGDEVGAPHLTAFLSRAQKTCLTRLRVGSLDLHVHTGRFRRTPRELRSCPACGSAAVEDLAHFTLHCPAHASVRARFSDLFHPPVSVHSLLDHPNQPRLATCMLEMLASRQPAPPALTATAA
jgi:hypothetical protein